MRHPRPAHIHVHDGEIPVPHVRLPLQLARDRVAHPSRRCPEPGLPSLAAAGGVRSKTLKPLCGAVAESAGGAVEVEVDAGTA
jgi:hypothetical protein